ncbi:4Fe-4S binding protein [Candidatus Solincola sp.]|jgi:pyruvate ferredoxin oxidoreductase delta subunit|nr:4Fe-4S binding protein [Actinomycetota bacterium]
MPGRKRKEKPEEIGFLTTLSVPSEGSVGLTGTWRTFRPVLDQERCNKCLLCWIYCPEACITKELRINYDYCKGCGVCAEECPTRAMSMVKEDEYEDGKDR